MRNNCIPLCLVRFLSAATTSRDLCFYIRTGEVARVHRLTTTTVFWVLAAQHHRAYHCSGWKEKTHPHFAVWRTSAETVTNTYTHTHTHSHRHTQVLENHTPLNYKEHIRQARRARHGGPTPQQGKKHSQQYISANHVGRYHQIMFSRARGPLLDFRHSNLAVPGSLPANGTAQRPAHGFNVFVPTGCVLGVV